MNDEFRNTIKRLRDIYNYLTEGEPSPDEEEESQKEMITLLESLIMHIPPENMEENLELLKISLGMAKNWDTLEFWFKEKPELVTNVKLILNRFLIRHAEPEQESKPAIKIPKINGVPDELSGQLAAALERAMKNLPPDADVTKVIQSVTSQVTENYKAEHPSVSKGNVGLGGVPIKTSEKAEASEGSSQHNQSTMGHNYGSQTPQGKSETMMSTAARVKIRKEDIMKSVLAQVKNKITETEPSHKLVTPKIVIPKVTKPKQKIVPYSETKHQPLPTEMEQKQQELDTIPPLQPQERPKKPPKLKVSAFKKDKRKQKITTHAEPEPQQPVRPKIVVKPKIRTSVQEITPSQHIPKKKVTIKTPGKATVAKAKVKTEPDKPGIDQGPTETKKSTRKQKKSPRKPKEKMETTLKFNILKPTEPKVKDTQINLFETFTKQEKKSKRRKSRRKHEKSEVVESEPESKPNPMEGIKFPDENIPYEKMDKAQLYQELIALEGKKYAIEKSRKDFRAKHEKGLISDGNYAAQLDRFKFDLQYNSKKINDIRQRIQTL